MAPNAGGMPTGDLAKAIETDLGGFEKFKLGLCSSRSTTRFGSGWACYVLKKENYVCALHSNQDNPLMDIADYQRNSNLGNGCLGACLLFTLPKPSS